MDSRLEKAKTIIKAAGELALKFYYQLDQLKTTSKGLQDFATEADTSVENYIMTQLKAQLPADEFFGEETGGEIQNQGWVVDPIDGTTNFLRGIPFWCISMAFVKDQKEEQKVELGLIFDPVHKDLFVAQSGKGAELNGEKIKVTEVGELSQATICYGQSFRTDRAQVVKALDQLLAQKALLRLSGSAALAMAYVSCGRFDGFFEQHLNSWDFYAAKLLVEEAGGVCSPESLLGTLKTGAPVACSNQKLFAHLPLNT